MTDQTRPPIFQCFATKGRDERRHFGVDRLFDQSARPIAQDASEWIAVTSRLSGTPDFVAFDTWNMPIPAEN